MILFKIWQALMQKVVAPMLDLFVICGLTGLLAFARLYTSFLALHDFGQRAFPGFTPAAFIKMALGLPLFFSGDIDDIEKFIEFKIDGIPYWDAGVYWGPFLILVLICIMFLAIKAFKRESRWAHRESLPILIASLGVWLLSFGGIYTALASFLAGQTGISAFEGIEKYPFRFALPAYFGLSLWFADTGVHLLQEIRFPSIRKAQDRQFGISSKIPGSVGRLLPWQAGLLVAGLIAWFAWGKPALLNEIRKAYFGSGLIWMEKLMTQRADLPLTAYLEKATVLSGQVVIAALSGLAVCLVVLVCLRSPGFFKRAFTPLLHWVSRNRMTIVEVVLIAPLIIASLNWMRVATATPLYRFERPLKLVPEMQHTSNAKSKSEITALTPSLMQIYCSAGAGKVCNLKLPIKHREMQYFTITPEPIGSVNHGTSLDLTLAAQTVYSIKFDTKSFDLPVFFGIFNWLWAGVVVIFYVRKSKRALL